jgi:hypothetical protein
MTRKKKKEMVCRATKKTKTKIVKADRDEKKRRK